MAKKKASKQLKAISIDRRPMTVTLTYGPQPKKPKKRLIVEITNASGVFCIGGSVELDGVDWNPGLIRPKETKSHTYLATGKTLSVLLRSTGNGVWFNVFDVTDRTFFPVTLN